jgi:lipopolysaccharide export system permease protein
MIRPLLTTIDRYLLASCLPLLAGALGVALVALLMERLLRLFRLVAGGGGPIDLVAWMALNLVPHYLGLAIPVALFIAIHGVVVRLDGDSELDAIKGAGIGLRRAGRSFFLLAMILAAANLMIVGWLQPVGRYQYRALAHAVSQGVWDGTLPEGVPVRIDQGLVVSAARVEGNGARLSKVMVRRELSDGAVLTIVAQRGRLALAEDRIHMRVQLEDGIQLRHTAGGGSRAITFTGLTDVVAVRVVPVSFRARGAEERELTLPELSADHATVPPHRLAAELHGRLARSAALPVLPMLAFGVAVASKRAPRGLGLAAGVAMLFAFHHALLTGESLAEAGRMAPAVAAWGPWALFTLVSLAVYIRLDRRPLAWRAA